MEILDRISEWLNTARNTISNALPGKTFGMDTIELIGLAASVLVLVSFLMKEVRVIRTIGIAACVFFVAYGVLIDALSIWLLNGILIFVHLYYLIKSRKYKGDKKHDKDRRLGKFSRASFDKKGLRELPWFFKGDSD